MNILRTVACITALVTMTTLIGCARFPAVPPTTGRQIVFTLKVRGKINPIDSINGAQRYYFIAIDNDGDPNTFPVAVYYPPYGGNGWVTSDEASQGIGLTSFVQFDSLSASGLIWQVLPGTNFLNTVNPQPPIYTEIVDGGSALRVTVDFSQLATGNIPADQIQQLNVNFITTNALPRGGQYDTNPYPGRETDGLGPSGREAVSIMTNTDRIVSIEDGGPANPFQIEDYPPVTDPDLDIVSATIEIQTVSSR